jgi:hypothetical protein
MKRLLLLLALGATALVGACSPSGSSANPDQTGPVLDSPSAPVESMPVESPSPS